MKGQDHCNRSGCPIACGLDVIGDRWTLLIVRELLFKNKHEYGEFLAMEEGISTNILADRLKKLQENAVISSFPHPTIKARKVYYLTEAGKELINIMLPIVLWSAKHLKDVVEIPAARKEHLKNPQKMIEGALQQLKLWEQNNLPSRM